MTTRRRISVLTRLERHDDVYAFATKLFEFEDSDTTEYLDRLLDTSRTIFDGATSVDKSTKEVCGIWGI
jgi:hypothetical protein